MRKLHWFPVMLTVLVLGTGGAGATVVPGRWEKVETLKEKTKIIVELKAGDRLQVRFAEVREDALLVTRYNGEQLGFPKGDVARVLLPGKRDNKPVWLGAAIGGGAGLAVGLISASQTDETIFGVPQVMGPVLGGIGAAAGAAVGLALRKDPEPDAVIYSSR